ncbi:hypothetical protein N7457_008728 [Penicillium paradoxum]|uniref:uncharacterized protein n=1 Tax=Penicillium paradoxum TaxID=176176 RepID=UPI002548209D|nr:uncharacterized protein N7457_008728 [Penicillium paradoxum]KAJ5773832.1 hypothetical protein N7457_008728 [Penicillium paradoxum]
MAPLRTRQSHSLGPGIPRPPKRPPNTPVKVDKSIDPKVFGELLAGTVVIFILAVLFWKIGQFVRRFNRDKVLRAGKSTHTRYARTWYGWVARSTHERNKKLIHDFFAWIWDSLAWKSSRDDYSWIWWDPGDVKRQKRRRQLKGLRWLPDCFKSYDDFPTADEIWNPCARPECHGALKDSSSIPHRPPVPEPIQWPRTQETPAPTLPQQSVLIKDPPVITRSILEELFRDPLKPNDGSSDHQPLFNYCKNTPRPDTRTPMPFRHVQSLPCRQNRSYQRGESMPWSRAGESQPIRCQIQSVARRAEFQYNPVEPNVSIPTKEGRKLHSQGHSRRHRGWSARMQMGPKAVDENMGDSSGPPGTPRTELLASYISDPSSSFRGHLKQQRASAEGRLRISEDRTFASRVLMGNQLISSNERQTYTRTIQWYSAPARSRLQGEAAASKARPELYNEWRSICDPKNHVLSHRQRKLPAARCSADQIQLKTGGNADPLNDWEVRMLERLDRKLVWLFDEFTPGQKPYHFALLANHWLNRETWLVYDPISRVPNDARREWGDPRFNVPYPQPVLSPRPKYQVSSRKRVQTPRINSWRAAVNRQREIYGIRETIRTITLYEESAEEPPDGHIDPGCWVLPKPPQGFEMSTAQKNAWYEGGAGWQEKLEDWQKVRRGYRLHKAIHEGRVNRDRLKEVAAQVHKCCRSASGKLIPSYDLGQTRVSNFLVS